jgi:hypothetical protein
MERELVDQDLLHRQGLDELVDLRFPAAAAWAAVFLFFFSQSPSDR